MKGCRSSRPSLLLFSYYHFFSHNLFLFNLINWYWRWFVLWDYCKPFVLSYEKIVIIPSRMCVLSRSMKQPKLLCHIYIVFQQLYLRYWEWICENLWKTERLAGSLCIYIQRARKTGLCVCKSNKRDRSVHGKLRQLLLSIGFFFDKKEKSH